MKKAWKDLRGQVPTSGKLQLPEMLNGTRIYFDRLTGIFYREVTCNGPSSWSYYEPPKLRRKKLAPQFSFSSDERRPGDNEA